MWVTGRTSPFRAARCTQVIWSRGSICSLLNWRRLVKWYPRIRFEIRTPRSGQLWCLYSPIPISWRMSRRTSFLGRFRVLFFLPLRRLSFLNFTHETLFHPSFLLTAAQIPNRFELSRGCGMTATHFRLLKASKQTNKQSERPRLLIKEMSM